MFYTYIHRRNDTNEVFYVGKGSGFRINKWSGRNQHWKNIVRKHGFKSEMCARWDSEIEAFEHEKFLIQTFRSMGAPLVNVTDGRDKSTPCEFTPELRERISTARKRQFSTLEGRIKMSIARSNKHFVCIETGQVFISQKQAAAVTGLSRTCVGKVLNGIRSHTNGLTFKYLEKNLCPLAEARTAKAGQPANHPVAH